MGKPTAPPDIGDDVVASEDIAEGVQRENESGHRVSDHRTTSSTPRARTADGGTARKGQTWQKRQQPWSPSLGAGGSYEDPKDWGPDLRKYMSERNTAAERSFRVTRADPSSVYHTPREVLGDHFRRLSEPGMTTAQCPTRRAEMQHVTCAQQVDVGGHTKDSHYLAVRVFFPWRQSDPWRGQKVLMALLPLQMRTDSLPRL
eukprot:CAMPEP_0177196534 /NCGR_PEP_ID=MMETSP0367-20130122/24094_1 /TAXON_ID=447022 ORGANISM="Scrippsiella hangoei-like, Strain SHHI-4" /NCGR_SAMPLE_ID=MMETSP0367 /ASSEMBLY_ACC=CAM_ASM_000362 /LENGTH=201 /DNA_ID=CAMNT_0018644627 /DNA_START=18 /DNA_END=624 /DNA_ORIENTATION=-